MTTKCAMEGRVGSGDRTRCANQCEHCEHCDRTLASDNHFERYIGPDGSVTQRNVTHPGSRDPEFEREFLLGAEMIAGLGDGFPQRVADRLLRSERIYGRDSYRNLSIVRILKEIQEEALDLGGWSVLAALLSEATLDSETVIEARMILQEIAAHGAKADALLTELRRLVDEAR